MKRALWLLPVPLAAVALAALTQRLPELRAPAPAADEPAQPAAVTTGPTWVATKTPPRPPRAALPLLAPRETTGPKPITPSREALMDSHPPVVAALSIDQLGELYQARLQPMFGDGPVLTDEHKVWWSYVGHFLFAPGYVYAYAFGNLLALSVYHRYLEVGPSFVDRYMDFLGSGGSTRPDELVKRVGMDITDPTFWDKGLDILDGMVKEVERLAG